MGDQQVQESDAQFGCCRGCGAHRDLSPALMCTACVEVGVPVPRIGAGHGDGVPMVPRSDAEALAEALERARRTLWKAGFTICADASAEALAAYRANHPKETP